MSSTPAADSRPRRRRANRETVALLVVIAVTGAFYMWTADSSVPFSFDSGNSDVYNELTRAFLHGHTYFETPPPRGLTALANPYDPVANAPFGGFHDLALYGHHFYSAWGPTPALTLFLPFRLTGLRMSESFAVALLGLIGLICAALLLRVLLRRFVPAAPSWLLVLGSVALALGNVLPFLLRRPAVYEVAIAAGYCFAMAGLWLLTSAVLAPVPRLRRLAGGSLCLGLAAGARPTLLVLGAGLLLACVHGTRRGDHWRRMALVALAPFVLCCLLLGAYNQERFGSPGQFGQKYQLAGIDTTRLPTYDFSYLEPGLYYYLFAPPHVLFAFPHVFLGAGPTDYPGTLPHGYNGTTQGAEPTGGVLATAPLALLLVMLPALWRRGRHSEDREALLAASVLALAGFVILFGLALVLPGTTERYAVDFTSLFLLAALLVWALVLRRVRCRRRFVMLGVGLIAIGSVAGVAISFTGYHDLLLNNHPRVYRALEDITAPVATLPTILAGRPVIARLEGPEPVYVPALSFSRFGAGGSGTYIGDRPVTVTILAPGEQDTRLLVHLTRGPGAPPGTDATIVVRSPARPPNILPVLTADMQLPVHLRPGLNRVQIEAAGPPLGRTTPAAVHTRVLRMDNVNLPR